MAKTAMHPMVMVNASKHRGTKTKTTAIRTRTKTTGAATRLLLVIAAFLTTLVEETSAASAGSFRKRKKKEDAQPVKSTGMLTEEIMDLTMRSALLSAAVFDSSWLHLMEASGSNGREKLEYFHFFNDEPDASVVTKWEGMCYAIFRGSTEKPRDWTQNFNIKNERVCNNQGECCRVEEGFYTGLGNSYQEELEKAILDCAATCENPTECVVLGGYSQGGAVAGITSIKLSHLNPYVIAFGMPRALHRRCDVVNPDRWYRFINSRNGRTAGISYDPVAFVGGNGDAVHYGHGFILSDDSSGVSYFGRNSQQKFKPSDVRLNENIGLMPLNFAGFRGHLLGGDQEDPGYVFRLTELLKGAKYPIRDNGYAKGFYCSHGIECQSRRCTGEKLLNRVQRRCE